MDLEKLKRVYGAARNLRDHNQKEAAPHVGKSESMINQVLSGTATSEPTEDAILNYCYEAGLEHIIKKLDLKPNSTIAQSSL